MVKPHLRVAETKSNHQVLEIDIDNILAVQLKNDEGMTTQEWADALNISLIKMRKLLGVLVPEGKFQVGKQLRKLYSGKNGSIVVYKWVG